MNIDPLLTSLCVIFTLIAFVFWRVQRDQSSHFDLLDLLMENGRVSKIAVAFMLVLIVSTWVIIDMQIKGKLTEGIFGLWLGAWVVPLVAKVVFNKTEAPAVNSVLTETRTIESRVSDP